MNNIHSTGHLTSNQVQNLGVSVLSEVDAFDGRWEIPNMINREFREILKATLPYLNLYSNFLNDVAAGGEEGIIRVTECDRELIESFTLEAARDLRSANNCIVNL